MSNMLRSNWSICVLEFPRLFVVSGLQPSNSLVFFCKCQQSNPRGVFFVTLRDGSIGWQDVKLNRLHDKVDICITEISQLRPVSGPTGMEVLLNHEFGVISFEFS